MAILRVILVMLGLALAGPILAQGTKIPLGGASHDASQPVEITADQLDLDQAAGQAVFSGSVLVVQGELRMAADRIKVHYAQTDGDNSGQIDHMEADGKVTLTNGTEAAEADSAEYKVATGLVEMRGNVLMTQGANALSGDTLNLDLNAGTGTISGRVKTIFQPGAAQ